VGTRCTCYVQGISPLPGEVIHRYFGPVYFAICVGCAGDRHVSNIVQYLKQQGCPSGRVDQARLYEAGRTTSTTLCPNGHPRSPGETYVRQDGRWSCRICHRKSRNESNRLKREAVTR